MPTINEQAPISVSAEQLRETEVGEYKVYELYGGGEIRQGPFVGKALEINLWVDKASDFNSEKPVKVLIEMRGPVELQWSATDRLSDVNWSGRLFTTKPLEIQAQRPRLMNFDLEPKLWGPADRSVYVRPVDGIDLTNGSGVQPAQYTVPTNQLQGSFNAQSSPLGGIVLDNAGNIIEEIPAIPQERQSFQLPQPEVLQVTPPIASPNLGGIPSTMGPSINANPTVVPDATTGTLPVDNSVRPRIGAQTFAMTGRGNGEAQIEIKSDPSRAESIIVITRGVRLSFAGAAYQGATGAMDLGTVTLEADRVVIWTTDVQRLLAGNASEMPIEVYLDGNVVFQQGLRKVYADRMYYNPQAEVGTILNAEILTPVPMYEGILRLKADVVQQRSRQNFLAYDAAITSSRMGVPRYWLQADRLELKDDRNPNDPNQYLNSQRTGTTNMEATARNNFVYIDRIPVFYWPYVNTNVDSPNFFITGAKVKRDQIFGQQVYVDSDLYQLLGIDGADGTDWKLSTDYLSDRGFALGTTFRYNRPDFIFDGPANGFIDAWGIQDRGLDTLGLDRVKMTPEATTRGRAILRHRQQLSRDWEFRAEAGYQSDRNFLEQYFEREWDQEKDQSTTLRLRHYGDNSMMDLWGQVRVNDFYTETEWLPRLDYMVLGQSFFDRFTWYANSHVGYARQLITTAPTDPQDLAKFQLLPWEIEAEGIRAGTRQELALPLAAGPFKFVPYVNGEVMAYGEDLNGDSDTRLTGQAGIRTSMPMWRVYDDVQSKIFNINGLAHKMNWHSEFFYADTTKNLSELPLYDPLDDNSQEAFRRRMIFNTFGGVMPPQYDSRSYAVRQGLQRYVTANSLDVVEDQMQFRVGLDQRWQTKRGLPGRERIADLYEVDMAAILFPKSERDNFGETVGAITYASRVHLGDRVTLLGDGYADLFDGGLRVLSSGILASRPGVGQIYVGLSQLTGPIDSTIFSSNLNYRLNEKFLVFAGATYDFGEVGNVGQTIGLTRIGESFLFQIGANVDSGRDNTVFNFSLEPRFLPIRGLGAVGGKLIPPAGMYGLE